METVLQILPVSLVIYISPFCNKRHFVRKIVVAKTHNEKNNLVDK